MSVTYQLQGLTTGYRTRKGDRVVTRHITASLQAGEFTCLLGPNGAGKSTLLRTLAAFQPPLDGDIILNGQPLSLFTPKELAKHLGVVLTERPNIKGMRVREMIALGRSPYTDFWGRLQADDLAAIDEAIQQVGIQDLQQRMVHTLSDGERQKVMIAKALAQQTPIIFLDEPTAFLDFPSKAETMLLLRRLAHDMQKTIFLSTHDVELALQTADRLWLMQREGPEQLVIGTPQTLAATGALQHFFSGPGITFNAAELRFHIQLPTDESKWKTSRKGTVTGELSGFVSMMSFM